MRDWVLILGGNVVAWFGAVITPESVSSTIGAVVASIVAIVAGVANIRVAIERRKAAQDNRATAAALRAKAEAEARASACTAIVEQRKLCSECISGSRFEKCGFDNRPMECPQRRQPENK